MERSTKMVLVLAFSLATFLASVEGRNIQSMPKPYQPDTFSFGNYPGFGAFFGNHGFSKGGSVLAHRFGKGKPGLSLGLGTGGSRFPKGGLGLGVVLGEGDGSTKP